MTGGSGGPRLTLVWTYNANTDQFDQIFDHEARRQNNGEKRIVTNGPWAGDIVKYNDGNPLPVMDAEMPEIERRLNFWTPGEPLPTPARTLCGRLELRHGIEWCQL
jgi:hypothetical protein